MSTLTFEVKTSSDTKYGFKLRFTYNVSVDWFYNNCRIKVTTYHHNKLIMETTVSENKYNSTIDSIKQEMESGKYKDILVKDFGRCVACKQWMDEPRDKWKYEEYDMFCGYDCQRKPIADKCIVCSKNVPRRYGWCYPNHCSVYCAAQITLMEKTILPKDIILSITGRI